MEQSVYAEDQEWEALIRQVTSTWSYRTESVWRALSELPSKKRLHENKHGKKT